MNVFHVQKKKKISYMNRFKLLLILLIASSCTSVNEKYFKKVEGEWQITQFYHGEENLMSPGYYIMGFQESDHLWMLKREGRESKFVSSKYKFSKKLDTLQIDIKNSEDVRLNGNYTVYIDTISQTRESYIIQLTLDSENTYLEAIRSKLKYDFPPL